MDQLNEAVVVCPTCGEAFTVKVVLSQVQRATQALVYIFENARVVHSCR